MMLPKDAINQLVEKLDGVHKMPIVKLLACLRRHSRASCAVLQPTIFLKCMHLVNHSSAMILPVGMGNVFIRLT